MGGPTVVVVEDAAELGRVSADLVAGRIAAVPEAWVAVATGETPMGLYAKLAARCRSGRLDTSRLTPVQLDEYLGLEPDDRRTFFGWMRRSVLEPLGIADDRAVRLPLEGDLAAACAAFDQTLDARGGLDLAILGIGTNGHLGFNEPPVDRDAPTREVELSAATIASNARYWGGVADVPTRAVTTGMRPLLSASAIVMVVSGPTKREIVHRALEEPVTPQVPASFLQESDADVTVVVDREAWGEGDSAVKMTLLGAGVRAPFVLRGLTAGQEDLGLDEVVVHDTDPERLELMAALGAYLCAEWGARFTVRGEPDAAAAIAGARFVFSAIRPGQEGARRVDEEVPLKFGVLGQETTGPGGFAMALRTIPAMLGYARLIEGVAPDALLVNFTNPVGIVMQALHDHSSVRAVGICDGPVSMQRSVAAFLGQPRERVHADYFGLNHCGWIHRVLVDGRDRLPELLDRFEELQEADEEWRLFDPALVRAIGMLPMEYLYFYYYRDEALAHIRGSGGSRGGQLQALNDALWPVLRTYVDAGDLAGARAAWERAMAERDATYFARERGETVPDEAEEPGDVFEGEGYQGVATAVMAAAVQRRTVPMILNVPNRGAIGGLRDDDVVEVTCVADEHGAHPLAQGVMPEAQLALIRQVKLYERLTVRAAIEGSYEAALDALLAHPLVASYPAATAILEAYVEDLAGLLPRLS